MMSRKVQMALLLTCLGWAGCTERGLEMKEGGRAPGKILTVDSAGDSGRHVTLELDLNDKVHMVYTDQTNKSLKYVTQSSAGFAISTVDDTCLDCSYSSMKMDAANEPHVIYYNGSNKTLTYAYRNNQGKWLMEPIEWGQGTGMGAQLLIDESGSLHALYYSGDGYLKHAWRILRSPNQLAQIKRDALKAAKARATAKARRDRKRGKKGGESSDVVVADPPVGLWGNERVDKANGSEKVQISFVRQPNERLAASYLHWSGLSSELRLAVQEEDGQWGTEVVAFERNPGKSSALFFTSTGEPRVIFREARKDRLVLAESSMEGWKITALLPKAYNLALARDATHNLIVAYEKMDGQDPRKGHLCMAWRKSGLWTHFVVDPGRGSGSYLSAALTAAGVPIVAYFEERNKTLKVFIGE